MANLTQHARLPILNGSILPYRIDVDTAIDDVPYTTASIKTSQIHLSIGIPIWANRNVSLNPVMAYGHRPMALGENMAAAYYDQGPAEVASTLELALKGHLVQIPPTDTA